MRVGAACRAAPVRQAPLGMPGLTSNGHSLQSRHALRISVRQPRKAEQPHSSQLTAERASVAGGDKHMDPYRLPRHVVPTRYDLRLQPDLSTGTFTGEETITVTVHQAAPEVLLNAAELRVTRAAAEGPAGISQTATVTLDEATERCRL